MSKDTGQRKQIKMKDNVLQRLDKLDIPKHARKLFLVLHEASKQVSFGKISARQEGYICGDLKLPRCTSILQMDGTKAGALMEWAKRQVAERIFDELNKLATEGKYIGIDEIDDACRLGLADPDRQKNEAADFGTGKHDNIENYLMGYQYTQDDTLDRFKAAFDQLNMICVATEIPLIWNDENKHGFGGRMDLLLYSKEKDEWYIGDNKTSRSVHESYGCQVGAYKAAIEQMTYGELKIAGGVLFHLPDMNSLNERQKKEYDKRGSLVMLKNLDEAFEHYKLLLELYYKRNNKYF